MLRETATIPRIAPSDGACGEVKRPLAGVAAVLAAVESQLANGTLQHAAARGDRRVACNVPVTFNGPVVAWADTTAVTTHLIGALVFMQTSRPMPRARVCSLL